MPKTHILVSIDSPFVGFNPNDAVRLIESSLAFQEERDNIVVELVDEAGDGTMLRRATGPDEGLHLNGMVDTACYIENNVVQCKNIGNVFTKTIAGFPVDEDPDRKGIYFLYDSVFNNGEVPSGWGDVTEYRAYENTQLRPWLTSIGFTDIKWRDGERDSFGPLSRVATMRRGKNRFEFVYG